MLSRIRNTIFLLENHGLFINLCETCVKNKKHDFSNWKIMGRHEEAIDDCSLMVHLILFTEGPFLEKEMFYFGEIEKVARFS